MTLTEKEQTIIEKMRLLQHSDDPVWKHLADLLLDSLTRLAAANSEYNVGEPIQGKFPYGGISAATYIIDNAKRIASHTKRFMSLKGVPMSLSGLTPANDSSWRDKSQTDNIGYSLLSACYLAEFGPLPQECYWPDCTCTLKDKCSCV